jgi:hypothetical protein
MFGAGLNGDDTFYGWGGNNDDCGGYAPRLYDIKRYGCTLTGVTTEKAVQLRYKDVTIWMPKKLMTYPHPDHFTEFGLEVFINNLKEKLKEKL